MDLIENGTLVHHLFQHISSKNMQGKFQKAQFRQEYQKVNYHLFVIVKNNLLNVHLLSHILKHVLSTQICQQLKRILCIIE